MFYHLDNLKYLDLSNFDTSSITTIRAIAMYCGSLLYINLKNFKFDTSKVSTFRPLYKTPSYLKVCIENSSVKNALKNSASNLIYSCTNTCFNKKYQFYVGEPNNGRCVQECSGEYQFIKYDTKIRETLFFCFISIVLIF